MLGFTQKKKRTHLPQEDSARKTDAKSFVFWRGRFGVGNLCLATSYATFRSARFGPFEASGMVLTELIDGALQVVLKQLETDLRKLLAPNTANNLKVGSILHDYMAVS